LALSREQLFAVLGLIKLIDPLTDRAYSERELEIWLNDLENSPHGVPWHTSFHASSFPGDSEWCARKAVYGLLNVPRPEPTSRFLRSVGDAGKDIERQVVSRWAEMGILLSAAPEETLQTGFVDKEYWLTGSTDAVVLPYRWRKPHMVEVKSKAVEKVEEMKWARRSYDLNHRNQCLSYIGLAHEQHPWKEAIVCKDTWRLAEPGSENVIDAMVCAKHGIHADSGCLTRIDLEPCTSGSIYYVARDDPSNTFEYYLTYDPEFMANGREKLAEAKGHFLEGTIPDRPADQDGKVIGWSEQPCKWCPLKKHVCKPDFQKKIKDLADSHAIEYTQDMWPHYDYERTRKAVLDRWQ
jgi:hypothetical protein